MKKDHIITENKPESIRKPHLGGDTDRLSFVE